MGDRDDYEQNYAALAGWYHQARLHARREDIFAGMLGGEFLVVEGDSIIERVLSDERLNSEGVCFQATHARYLLEQLIYRFKTHSENFAVIFFEVHRHMPTTSRSNGARDAFRRSFFRTLLKNHMHTLRVRLHTFEDFASQSWKTFRNAHMPGMICANILDYDCSPTPHDLQLIRMTTVFHFLSSGLHVADLNSIEFEESRGITFILKALRPSSASPLGNDRRNPYINMNPLWSKQRGILSDLDNSVIRVQGQSNAQDVGTWSERVLRAFLNHRDGRDLVNIATLRIWFAHQSLLSRLAPADRALPPPSLSQPLVEYITSRFYPLLFPILQADLEENGFVLDVDGSVFGFLLDAVLGGAFLESLVGDRIVQDVDGIWAAVGSAAPRADILPANFARAVPSAAVPPRPSIRTLDFEHEVFDRYISDIHTPTDQDPLSNSKQPISVLLNPYAGVIDPQSAPAHRALSRAPPVDEKARNRRLRKDQREMTRLTRLAGSLTGAAGAVLQQQVIVAAPPSSSKGKLSKNPQVSKTKPKPGKAVPLSKAEQIRQANTKLKAAQADASADVWWRNQLGELKKLSLIKQQGNLEPLFRNPKAQDELLKAEMTLYRLDLVVRTWIDDPKADDAVVAERYRVHILAEIKSVSGMKGCTPSVRKTLEDLLKALGMNGVELPKHPDGDSPDRSPLFVFTKTWSKSKERPAYPYFPIQGSTIEFQLRAFGEYMDRSMDSKADYRTSFDPDAWQVAVLDKIDQRSSMLVVAPTSAGKTFIGFYAMEKILRGSDDDILVYVAPTKALVTQVGAEVYARFRKDRKGGSCWAIHTREIQLNSAFETQILVTIPEVLVDLYMNPALSKTWLPRIRYVIFDEIHSISEGGGTIWTQLILMTQSPIIGLSATVGDAVAFNTWLEGVQNAHGHKHALIMHPHRYSHLRKFAWAGSNAAHPLRFIHPLAPLELGPGDLPADVSLESQDCLSLFQALVTLCGPDGKTRFADLEPNTFFKTHANRLLRQKDVIDYETTLKKTVQSLSRSPDSEDRRLIKRVLDFLAKGFFDTSTAINPRAEFFIHKEELGSELASLLKVLDEQQDLPALLFTFSRNKMEQFAQHLLKSLLEAEENYRTTSPKWQKNLQEWDRWLRAQSKIKERDTSKISKRKGGGGDDDDGSKRNDGERGADAIDDGGSLQPPPGVQDPDDPSPEFSYASFKRYTREELADDMKDLAWSTPPQWVLDCLKRGIAIHHAGMSKPYRSLIETLFRLGYIRVMFSTETLALGINAPARTSIFLGDSKFLSPLLYRQCAGRAGRRGFDLLGKVVFMGVPLSKICRLNLADLQPLTGRYPITVTFVLQFLRLLHGSNEEEAARRAVDGVLSLSRLTVDTAVGRMETACLLRFSIDLLRRSKLIDKEGTPLTVAPLAALLHEHQPGNLALVSLMGEGYFHRLCADFDNDRSSVMRTIILVLAHLFARKPILKFSTQVLVDHLKRSSSVVVLPALPREAQEILEAYNRRGLDAYTGFALTYASQRFTELGADAAMPLSGPVSPQTSEDLPFVRSLHEKSIRSITRSVFVANSGRGDDYETVNELCSASRHGINLERFMTPHVELPTEETSWVLNAAIYDFFIHGSHHELIRTNGIGRGQVWYLLKEFSLVLEAIQMALEQIFKNTIKAGGGADDLSTREHADIDDVREDAEDILSEGASAAFPERPKGLPKDDWDVYRAFVAIHAEFEEKFKAMWA